MMNNTTTTMNTTNTTSANNSVYSHNYNNYEVNNTNGFHHIDSSRIDMSELDSPPPPSNNHLNNTGSSTANHHTFLADTDFSQLSLEIEKENEKYHEQSRNLQEQLQTFRQEIDKLKVDDNVTNMDKLHKEQQDQGNNKYSTIQKVKRGSTQSRVEIFEELWKVQIASRLLYTISKLLYCSLVLLSLSLLCF